jgi:MFS family permease
LLLRAAGSLLAVVFALALVDTPLSAAVGRCIPAVVADDDLVAANALRGAVAELGTVLGPPLAGLLFAVSGTRLVLGLDALTFLAVVPLALRLPALERDTGGGSRPSFLPRRPRRARVHLAHAIRPGRRRRLLGRGALQRARRPHPSLPGHGDLRGRPGRGWRAAGGGIGRPAGRPAAGRSGRPSGWG